MLKIFKALFVGAVIALICFVVTFLGYLLARFAPVLTAILTFGFFFLMGYAWVDTE